jgi:hypothetical protein
LTTSMGASAARTSFSSTTTDTEGATRSSARVLRLLCRPPVDASSTRDETSGRAFCALALVGNKAETKKTTAHRVRHVTAIVLALIPHASPPDSDPGRLPLHSLCLLRGEVVPKAAPPVGLLRIH